MKKFRNRPGFVRSILPISIALLLFENVCSQTNLFFIPSWNGYSMHSLKNQQDELLSDIEAQNIPAKKVASYPPYYGFQFGFLIPLKSTDDYPFYVGGVLEFISSGARIHYQDYSGEILADQLVSATAFGGIFEYRVSSDKAFSLKFRTAVKYFYSSLDNSLLTQIGSNRQHIELKFNSSSFGIESGFTPVIEYSDFQLGISLSYLIFIPSNLESDNYTNAFFVNKHGDKVTIDWSGLRAGILIGFEL